MTAGNMLKLLWAAHDRVWSIGRFNSEIAFPHQGFALHALH